MRDDVRSTVMDLACEAVVLAQRAVAEADGCGDAPGQLAEFPGQIYKCLLNLYGNKEAARLY